MNNRPVRQARIGNRPNQDQEIRPNQDQEIPPADQAPGVVVPGAPADNEIPVQVVVPQEAGENLAAELDAGHGGRDQPRRQRRRINVDLSDPSSTSSEEEPELPRRRPRAARAGPVAAAAAVDAVAGEDVDEDEDELLKAVKAKKAQAGKWAKSHPGITPGEQVILAECRQLFAGFPECLASIIRLGGSRPLGDFLIQIQGMALKFQAMKDSLKFKVQVPAATELLIQSSLDLLLEFKEKFGPLAYTPSAVASIISFYSDGVFCALYGRDAASEACNQLRAFSKCNRTIASASFSSLMKWTNRSGHRQQNNQQKKSSHGGQSSREDRGYGRDDRGKSSMRRNRM